jgi:hypothetical protein
MSVREGTRSKGLYANKVGMMLPPSPRGMASLFDLNTEPDNRGSDDALVVGWVTDPAVTREYVPEPLEVDDSGEIYLMTVSRFAFTGRNRSEFISPERHTQTECFLKIPCTYQGERYVFRSFSWGNRDRLVTAGRQVGLYHKFADIQMTQFHPWHPVWKGPHEGARICVMVENIGTVLRAYGQLERPVPPDEELPSGVAPASAVPNVGHRYVYDSVTGKPARNDLVAEYGGDRETDSMWSEEVGQFRPTRMLGAWWYRSRIRPGSGRGGPRVIHDFGDVNPYASRPRIRELLEARA